MQYPLILVSSGRILGHLSMQRQQSELYGACLQAVGACGVLYTRGSTSRLAARCDGLLLSGGGDIHPALYGQKRENVPLNIDAVRDAEEQALFDAFFRRRKPILGICRGIQAINVFLGGTLHQHITGHENCCHSVRTGAPLSSITGTTCPVNSYHHQAVNQLAPQLEAAAWAEDGIIEAIYHPSAPVLGVQWHPERMVLPRCHDVPSHDHSALFRWLAERC